MSGELVARKETDAEFDESVHALISRAKAKRVRDADYRNRPHVAAKRKRRYKANMTSNLNVRIEELKTYPETVRISGRTRDEEIARLTARLDMYKDE
jgi:hypothetical protein